MLAFLVGSEGYWRIYASPYKRIIMSTCTSFTVTSGTGCAWMCSYCANTLGTNNYYFPDSVCTYQPGGCVGSPIAGATYTCCTG